MDEKDFFASEADQWVYYLVKLDGKLRQKKCGITMGLYYNQIHAQSWFNDVKEKIEGHVLYDQAYAVLEEIYDNMIEE